MKDIDKELSTILRKVVLFDEKDKLETELIANIKELFVADDPEEFEEELTEEEKQAGYEEQKEREKEAELESAANCTCGALQIVNWEVVKMADCICGAE